MNRVNPRKLGSKWLLKSWKETSVKPQDRLDRWSVLRGDRVVLLTGRDAGREGTVVRVNRRNNRVVVGGRNVVTKSLPGDPMSGHRSTQVQVEAAVHVSDVALVDPSNGQATKVSWLRGDEVDPDLLAAGGWPNKVRVARGSGAVIPRPTILRELGKARDEVGPRDTAADVVAAVTFDPLDLLPPLDPSVGGKMAVNKGKGKKKVVQPEEAVEATSN
uniref:KOW domain-containing protein n=1 Tax=Sexangularia sp. CB-2014 TaxID=1486929 RepID=A0A7S1VJJ9_9EUKA|mmetsp:Transcript_4891/g.15796  ORF Transcript_4891/g.15796 Transcript_4891/m.15796 type:complete len:217 (+) Transcript_4891:122-772(+)